MRHEGRWAAVMTVVLMVMPGCGVFFGMKTVSGGPFMVEVVDAQTGLGIEGAVVEWDYYFSSAVMDPAQRRQLGAEVTDEKGTVAIPVMATQAGDVFRRLNVDVEAVGYERASRKVTGRGGTIRFQLKRVG